MPVPNSILQNRYRVIRELGHGGMGTVYEALDQRVSCIVALKETSAGNNPEARNAFEREAALLANLRHSALPKVMDYFSEGESDFLVMEFIPGYDLAELLELRGGPFPQAQVLRWADALLQVLEYLHRQQPPILHRDIKPSNLKLTKQGEIFLLDFGLAKGAAGQMPTLVTSRSVKGYTPVYASIEQILGQGTDPRSDLYSLAATLHHLLTALPPKDAPMRFDALEDEQPDPLPAVEEVNPQVSANVAAVIRRAMAINRRQRPTSAIEMRKALRHAIDEDERHSAEEEYRRAEVRGQQREDERRSAAADLEREEEERQKLETETRRKEAEALSLAAEVEARRKADEEAARQVEEETRRRVADEKSRKNAAQEARLLAEQEALRLAAEEQLRQEEVRRHAVEEEALLRQVREMSDEANQAARKLTPEPAGALIASAKKSELPNPLPQFAGSEYPPASRNRKRILAVLSVLAVTFIGAIVLAALVLSKSGTATGDGVPAAPDSTPVPDSTPPSVGQSGANGGPNVDLTGVKILIVHVAQRFNDAEAAARRLRGFGAEVTLKETSDSGNGEWIGRIVFREGQEKLAQTIADSISDLERVTPKYVRGSKGERYLSLWIASRRGSD